MMMWYGNGFHWGWMVFGGLMMVLFWGGLIGLALVIARSFGRPGSESSAGGAPAAANPIEILKARYASGEISKEQFEKIRRDLAP